MKKEKERCVLFLYFVIEEMLLGGLVLPLLKERISIEGFHAFSLLAHLFLLVIVLLICFPFAVKQADRFREKTCINVLKSLFAAGLILAVQVLIVSFLRHAEITSANQQALAQMRNESILRYVSESLIYAPLMEELVFRHCLTERLNDHCCRGISVMISCVLFALMHVGAALFAGRLIELYYLPVYALCALILYLLKNNTGSLLSSVLAHMCVNLAVLVL